MNSYANTLVDVVRAHARTQRAKIAFTFLQGSEQRPHDVTFGQLDRRAEDVAAELARRGIGFGVPVLVLCPAGPEYLYSLIGCMYAGAIAVPTYPPGKRMLARAADRITRIVQDSTAAAAIVTCDQADTVAQMLGSRDFEIVIADEERQAPARSRAVEVGPEAGCILQYTSGSTSTPAGVLLSHANVVANQRQALSALQTSKDDVFVSWLPPFHDMGLMGTILHPLFVGTRSVQISPEAFLRKPRRWLDAVSRYRGTILAAPNFAYDLCVARIKAADRDALDLSRVRLAVSGAEPISADTLDRFSAAFAPQGFERRAFYPCYGLAEATLYVAGGRTDGAPLVQAFDDHELEHGRAVPCDGGRRLVGCGRAGTGTEIRVVDPETHHECGTQQIGEIWLRGPSVAAGYWRRAAATSRTFGAAMKPGDKRGFLRTGDLGFCYRGELFVTGRIKELVIIRGRNFYPHDIERCVQTLHPALVRNGGAAFAVETSDGERLVVVQELDKRTGAVAETLLDAVPETIQAEFGITPMAVVLIKRGTIPKTSSGKIQRREARAAYTSDRLTVLERWEPTTERAFSKSEADEAPRVANPTRRDPILPPPPAAAVGPRSPVANDLAAEHDTQSIMRFLLGALGAKIGIPASQIDPRKSLAQYGADSLMLAELAEEVEQWLGRPLPIATTYDNPSVAEMADAIAALARSPKGSSSEPRRPAPQPSRGARNQIAIVGVGCRFPGADSPAALWQLLRNQVDAVTETPAWRWDTEALYDPEPGRPGKVCTRAGGYLAGIDQFDPDFFDISQREAERMDPQQRLLMEVTWEALEEAGIDPTSLAGSDTGVFVGMGSHDYAILFGGDFDLVDADYCSGNSPAVAANRLSHTLDLRGPSITVDTACSSSLVALDAACTALEREECEVAIVAGVNAILAPETSISFSQAGTLSTRGRCQSFDANADGFVRSEGAGVLVLKRLSRASHEGSKVHAVIAGAAVNHGGRSNGLVAPSGRAQERVIAKALANAGITPTDLDYLEAHGVGAPIADSVELSALAALMEGRAVDRPCWVGSVKSNLGHLEAASGMASVIKAVLGLMHEEIPANLHFAEPPPKLDLTKTALAIPTTGVAWPRGQRPRHAGVSAFGFGGVNAHVVLREAPVVERTRAHPAPWAHLAVISARSEVALAQVTTRLARHLRGQPLEAVCQTLATGRAHFGHRRAMVVTSQQELQRHLLEFSPAETAEVPVADPKAPSETGPGTSSFHGRHTPGQPPALAFIFEDHPGSAGQLETLISAHPAARAAAEATRRAAEGAAGTGTHDGQPSMTAQEPGATTAQLDLMEFALHRALAALTQAAGIEPAVILGRGVGEISAACASGALSWDAAVPMVLARARTLASLVPGAAVQVTPRQFAKVAANTRFGVPTVRMIAGSSGVVFGPRGGPTGDHFARYILHSGCDDDGEEVLASFNAPLHATLGARGADAMVGDGGPLRLAMLAPKRDPWTTFLNALAKFYVAGVTPDFTTLHAPFKIQPCTLPTYPFERRRCWLDFPERNSATEVRTPAQHQIEHPLLSSVHTVTRQRSGFVRKQVDDVEDDQVG